MEIARNEAAKKEKARLAELKTNYDPLPVEQNSSPAAVGQLAHSELPVPRQTLMPVAAGTDLTPGTWSPDGSYLTFSRSKTLQVLDVAHGLVCSGGEEILLAADCEPQTRPA